MTGRELLTRLANRVGTQNHSIDFVSALNSTITALTNYLWSINSDWVRADFSVPFRAGASKIALPPDFLGFVEPPYIPPTASGPTTEVVNGTTHYFTTVPSNASSTRLKPLPANTDNTLAATGTPVYYDMRGTALKLFPTPSAPGVLKGIYNAAPPALSTLDEDLPFSGFFDPIIQDAVVAISQQGLFYCQTSAFTAMISQQVDRVLSKRAPKTVRWRGFK